MLRVDGKFVKRRSPATGVQVNDAAGNERAGVAVLDDGSAVVGIDHEHGQERAHLYWLPNKGSGLLQGDRPKEKMALSIPRAQAPSSGPTVEVWNKTGRPVYPTLTPHQ